MERYAQALSAFARQSTQTKIMRDTVNEALKPVEKAMKVLAPVASGNLRKSIRRVVNTGIKRAGVVHVGPVRTLGSHVHLVHAGTVKRKKKSGVSTGVMPSNDFMTQAWDENLATAQTIQAVTLGKRIIKEARRQMARRGLRRGRASA